MSDILTRKEGQVNEERKTGVTFILYCCSVCGKTITDRQPYYAQPSLVCWHGGIVYQMARVGEVPQIYYEERAAPPQERPNGEG